jgi:hypothetical protein
MTGRRPTATRDRAHEARAEVLRLAHVLGADPDQLAALEAVPPADVRRLREQCADALFQAGHEAFRRAAAVAEKLPGPLVAQLAQRALGAALSARTAAVLDGDRAVDLARRLPPDFLAEIAVHLDLRKLSGVVARVEPERVAGVARELARREEWVVMAALVDHLSDGGLDAALGTLDDEAILATGFLLEDSAAVLRRAGPAHRERLERAIAAR